MFVLQISQTAYVYFFKRTLHSYSFSNLKASSNSRGQSIELCSDIHQGTSLKKMLIEKRKKTNKKQNIVKYKLYLNIV